MHNMVPIAINAIRAARHGDTKQAVEVLRLSVSALHSVLNGELPDAEQVIYIQHLKESLEAILSGEKPADLALCLRPGTDGAPLKDTFDRDFVLFRKVGELLRSHPKEGITVTNAIRRVANQEDLGETTVKNAWQRFGALEAWKKCQALEIENEPKNQA